MCENTEITGQSFCKIVPAVISIINDVEASVSVVQLQPLDTFWKLKSG